MNSKTDKDLFRMLCIAQPPVYVYIGTWYLFTYLDMPQIFIHTVALLQALVMIIILQNHWDRRNYIKEIFRKKNKFIPIKSQWER